MDNDKAAAKAKEAKAAADKAALGRACFEAHRAARAKHGESLPSWETLQGVAQATWYETAVAFLKSQEPSKSEAA